jgi:hypothetical protein
MMLFRTCVVPIFRYSAPLVPWTWAELRRLNKIWSRAVKYSLHLPLSFDLAPILLDNAHWGLGLEPAANFMLKEIQIHVRQCLHLRGEVTLVPWCKVQPRRLCVLWVCSQHQMCTKLVLVRWLRNIWHQLPCFRCILCCSTPIGVSWIG